MDKVDIRLILHENTKLLVLVFPDQIPFFHHIQYVK